MTATMPTQAQRDRQHQRRRNGQYERNLCEVCLRPMPMTDYFSTTNYGYSSPFSAVCGRKSCPAYAADALPTLEAALEYIAKWQTQRTK